MQAKNTVRLLSCLAAGMAAAVALSADSSKTVDELAGLRPDTQGVETNSFWDTRAHTTYAVAVGAGLGTNAFDTAVLTVAASAPGHIGKNDALSIIIY